MQVAGLDRVARCWNRETPYIHSSAGGTLDLHFCQFGLVVLWFNTWSNKKFWGKELGTCPQLYEMQQSYAHLDYSR